MVSKSGGDGYHGTAYEFIRNKVLNANTYFNNQLGTPRPADTQNQYGVTLGGPIHPKTTFFFFSLEGFGLRQGISFTTTQPTAAELGGDSSAVLLPPLSIQPPVAVYGLQWGAAQRDLSERLKHCRHYDG